MNDRPFPRARKRFGQHFLEPSWATRLVTALDASHEDVFLEIGPGRGVLTSRLAERVHAVIGVEIDRDLAAALSRHVPAHVRIVNRDFLDVSANELSALVPNQAPGVSPAIRVVGNLPYNVSSPILVKLLRMADHGRVIRDATLMLQKEVADRVAAQPGGGDYGALSVHVGLVADVERLFTLPPGAFRPAPKVTSAVVRLRFRPPPADVGSVPTFERVTRGVFLQRRKTLLNALKPVAASFGCSAAELLERAGLDGQRRPQTLSVDEFARLSRAVL